MLYHINIINFMYIPEIILLIGFIIVFIYNIYIKKGIILKSSIIKNFVDYICILCFERQSHKYNLLVNYMKSIRSSLGLTEEISLKKYENLDRVSLLYFSFLCFIVFLLYIYQMYLYYDFYCFNYQDMYLLLNSIYICDFVSIFFKILVMFLMSIYYLICYILCKNWKFFGYEFGFFIFLIMFGLLFLISANDLFFIYLTIELQTLCIIILISYQVKNKISLESGIKYFILSSFFSGIYLIIVSFLYLQFGSVNLEILYQLVNGGTLGSNIKDYLFIIKLSLITFYVIFKLGIAPFSFWIPDVYQGSNLLVTTFLAVISKIGIMSFIIRFYYYTFYSFFFSINYILFISGILSLFAVFIALKQFDLKRFFAYTSISNFGHVILIFSIGGFNGVSDSLYYFIIYIFSIFSFFLIILNFGIKSLKEDQFSIEKNNCLDFIFLKSIEDFKGLYKSNKIMTFFLILVLLNLMGMPPFPLFTAKYFVCIALFYENYLISLFFVILTSLISVFYYLRIIKYFFMEKDIKLINFSFNSSLIGKIFYFLCFVIIFCLIYPDILVYIIELFEFVFNQIE